MWWSIPELAESWNDFRVREAAGRPVLTYCAGCAEHLGDRVRSLHLLDLLFGPEGADTPTAPPVGALRRYWNRLRLGLRAWRAIQHGRGR